MATIAAGASPRARSARSKLYAHRKVGRAAPPANGRRPRSPLIGTWFFTITH
jgi:hypothetical protein